MKSYSLPQVCLLQSDGPALCYAIREVSFDEENEILEVSKETLSPRCSCAEELRQVVMSLLEQATSGPIICGDPQRKVEKSELESWLECTEKPVIKIIENDIRQLPMSDEAALEMLGKLLDDLNGHERNAGRELGGFRQGIGFFVANHIARAQSVSLLKHCPLWIAAEVRQYVAVLEESGEVLIYTSVGMVDHTVMARDLKRAIEAPNQTMEPTR